MDAAVRRLELQAIPWMDQPAFTPVGSAFCGTYTEVAMVDSSELRLAKSKC